MDLEDKIRVSQNLEPVEHSSIIPENINIRLKDLKAPTTLS